MNYILLIWLEGITALAIQKINVTKDDLYLPYILPKDQTFNPITTGAGVDVDGNIYITNIHPKNSNDTAVTTIAKVDVNGVAKKYADLSKMKNNATMNLNGIQFDFDKNAFISDSGNSLIYKKVNNTFKPVCDFSSVSKINNLTLAVNFVVHSSGKIFASGLNFDTNTGGVFSCDLISGNITSVYTGGSVVGLAFDNCQMFLYFNEIRNDISKDILIRKIQVMGSLNPTVKFPSINNDTLVYNFGPLINSPENYLTGMRFDSQGWLYAGVYGTSQFVYLNVYEGNKIVPIFAPIPKLSNPTNLEFSYYNQDPYIFIVGTNLLWGTNQAKPNPFGAVGMYRIPASYPGINILRLRNQAPLC